MRKRRSGPNRLQELRSDLRVLASLKVLPLPRVQLWLLAGSVLLSSLCLLAIGRGIRAWTDAFLSQGTAGSALLLPIYLTVSIVLSLASGLRVYAATNIGEVLGARLRIALFRTIVGQELHFFETNAVGALNATVIADISAVQLVVRSSLSPLIRNVIAVVGAGILMAWTDWRLTALSLLILPVPILVFLVMTANQRDLWTRVHGRVGALAAFSDEVFGAIATIKTLGREEEETGRFSSQIEEGRALALRLSQARGILLAIAVLLGALTLGAMLVAGRHEVASGTVTAGTFSSFLFFLLLAAASCATLGNLWSGTMEAAAAFERIMPYLRSDPRRSEAVPVVAAAWKPRRPTPQDIKGLAFEAVTFRYLSRTDRPVLDRISFTVAPGETVAVAGGSGAGKSTLIRLLLRFDRPEHGRILLGNEDIAGIEPAELRSSVAVVPQDPFVFSATLAENIRYGRSGASDAEVAAAAEAAGINFFAKDLANGLDTHLGERGSRLSGGQRQRVAIARALIRQAPVLILDEATSALDARTEAAVQGAIFGGLHRPTTLVIAHRLATLAMANRVVVLNGGRIEATGGHEDLLRESDFYRSLLRVQSDPA